MLQRTFYCNGSKITEFEMIDTKTSFTAYVVDHIMVFGLEQEDGSFDYSHGAGTSSQSH